MWLAGGGVKPGITYGATDDFSYNVAENPVHVHDLHATVMHLLGIDHERFTFRAQGLEGIEAFYGGTSPVRAEPWLRLARELDLTPTGGSDFHGEALTDIKSPGIDLPLAHSPRLREWMSELPAIAS